MDTNIRNIDCVSVIMMVIRVKQQLSNIWSSIHENVKKQLGWVRLSWKKVLLVKKACIWFPQAVNDKVLIAWHLVQYWQIFSSFLVFSCYFTHLKPSEISCKIWETWKIFPILHSAPCDNNCLLHSVPCNNNCLHCLYNEITFILRY